MARTNPRSSPKILTAFNQFGQRPHETNTEKYQIYKTYQHSDTNCDKHQVEYLKPNTTDVLVHIFKSSPPRDILMHNKDKITLISPANFHVNHLLATNTY